mmetsp:Transcript_15463/g.30392  ORF Transcript_15463/g.30392 Transcript_15463/m.30392 type:complete len:206 (-) Transcript_15463:223-840(-)
MPAGLWRISLPVRMRRRIFWHAHRRFCNVQSGSSFPLISELDIRIGQVVSVEDHPDADSLYVQQIDVGEAEPRQILSGLKAFVGKEDLLNSQLLVVCNLKASKLRGIQSFGMVLAAASDDKKAVEVVRPRHVSQAGDKVCVSGFLTKEWPAAGKVVNISKKNSVWHKILPLLKTDSNATVCFDGVPLACSSGLVTVASLTDAQVS